RISPTAMQPKEGEPPMISAALGSVYKKMQRVATMLLPILLLGESGCGKSRLASYIHEWSGRGGKFVSLDCAGLTDEMFVCELFGHRGGHGQPREGAFRRARSGTLFLENVNLLTPTQQSMLLRILAPVGETKLTLPARPPFPACSVKVRIIASADASLADDIREGRFRTDLYYRLAGVSTTLPPVREYTYTERENLLRSFLVSLQQKLGQCWNFSGDAWQTLLDEKWPGNLREVTRILQQVCLLSDSSATITREEVLQQLRQGRFLNTVHSHAEPAAAKADSFEAQFVQASQDPAFSPDAASFGPVIAGDDDMLDSPLDSQDSSTPAPGIEDFFELGSGQSLEKALEQARNNKILEAMERAKGNRNEAATLLGMTPGQLNYALHRMRQNDASE
ncbi:MAG: sigma 54-interacting transcriptional regulator, partial [Desulfovibrionaceae bacterium]|nr:sigma 54-interacting transcriptional regulator [Desulfovibrionaceae bacterium]